MAGVAAAMEEDVRMNEGPAASASVEVQESSGSGDDDVHMASSSAPDSGADKEKMLKAAKQSEH